MSNINQPSFVHSPLLMLGLRCFHDVPAHEHQLIHLPPHAAETLLRLVEGHDMAADVFASEAGASAWLRTPHPLLDNEVPLDAVKTSYGAQLVKNLLMSTKYGGAA